MTVFEPSGDLPNGREQAEPIALDTFSVSGRVGGEDDPEDWFSFVAPVRGQLTIELVPLDNPLVFAYHRDGNPFPHGPYGGETRPVQVGFNVNGGETFAVQVRPWSSVGGTYSVDVQFVAAVDEVGNTFGTAQYHHAWLDWSDDVGYGDDVADVFVLDAFETGMHSLTLTGLRDNIDVFVYDDLGRLIAQGTETGTTDEAIDFPGIGGKRYTIEVKPAGDAVSHYDINVTNAPGPIDHGPIPLDNADNTFAQATEISGSTILSDAVGFDGDDADYYVIRTTEEGVRLTATLLDLADDLDLILYRADGFDVRSPLLGGPADETIVYDIEPDSTYFLGVLRGGTGNTESTYTLDVDLESFTPDENPSFDNATPISVPIVIEDSVGFAGDANDYFRFEAPASGVVRIALTDMDEDLDLWVFGPDTFPVADSFATGSADEYASLQVVAGEIYWIRVNPGLEDEFESAYRLTVDFRGNVDRAGDTLDTALPVPLPSRQLESVGFGGDSQDLYRITLPVSGTVHINLGRLRENLDLHLFDNTGRRIASAQTGGDAEESLSFDGAVGETFFIGIVPVGSASSPYMLTLGLEDARLQGLGLPNDPLFSDQWHLLNIGQRGGTGGIDLNVIRVWTDYTGAGVNVGIYDDGLETDHPDLAANYDPSLHLDGATGMEDPYNASFFSGHGTAVSGIVAAVANNGVGVTGIAHGASLTGAWVISRPPGRLSLSDALGQMDRFDVVNHSWGFVFEFIDSLDNPGFRTFFANLERTATEGRDGLGTIMVVAAGNGRFAESSSNYSNFSNSPFVIAVAAMDDDGNVASYSSPGANVLVSAPAGNFLSRQGDTITTTDTTGSNGIAGAGGGSDADGTGDYTRGMNGTSAAAPMVTGTVALMLEANPDLHWSEVHTILALSARQTGGSGAFEKFPWIINGADHWNGGGMHFSNDYGFGRVDAHAAVRMAETWHGGMEAITDADLKTVTQTFSAESGHVLDGELIIPFTQLSALSLTRIEVSVSLTGDGIENTAIWLRSPNGTESLLFDGGGTFFFGFSGQDTFTFTSNAFRGESSSGTWEVVLRSPDGSTPDTLESLSITFHGTDTDYPNDRYVFTDEFGTMLALDPSRGVLDDTDGSTNVLHMAAVTSDITLDVSGRSGFIGPNTLSWTDRTVFAEFITGDGNDSITGSHRDEVFKPGRGEDVITTGAGMDIVVLGPSTGEDTITDFNPDEGDKLDLRPLLSHAGYWGNNPISDGLISIEQDNTDVLVLIRGIALKV